ncbi:hypothetical protein B0H63DRAFT_19467 [Podospora didyma]|uniref:NACHT-NTPase and P-loop NTPases N-terminal domain-containing protein n=1 Tax=Podospora didyma TaxID=330526 RepID=A0AAE0U779_9PEZI|nr:hypothetical protein B0H63DRAFT_19467 [Podospora didyma]
MLPTEIIGLIAAIIDIIEGAIHVYRTASDASGLPQSLRDAAARLPLIKDTLSTAVRGLGEDQPQDLYDAMRACLEGSRRKAQKLEKIFREVVPRLEHSSWAERLVKATRATTKEGKVDRLVKGLGEDLQVLTANHALKMATRAEMKELIRAISSSSPPSPPSTDVVETGAAPANQRRAAAAPAHIAVNQKNTGAGTQNNHHGVGNQIVSAGGGAQISGVFNQPFNFSIAAPATR